MVENQVKKYIDDFTRYAKLAAISGNIDKACMNARISADIQYHWNQSYTDDRLEQSIEVMAGMKKKEITSYHSEPKSVLFYDGFGLDTRGLALIYIKALCDLDYKVIYVVPEKARTQQPEIHKVISKKNIAFYYLQNNIGDKCITEIVEVFMKYHPQIAFLYTYPSDVEACVAFCAMGDNVERYQINLTDHAFWLGRNAFDVCIEFRAYGASISYKYRKIPLEKIRMLHFYPYFDRDIPFDGFPFSTNDMRILFSGGSLYKTFDNSGTYYDMVRQIMQHNSELLFIYAGRGNKSKLMELKSEFPNRVFMVDERKDLYAVMQHSTLYLNTYPINGGLMTQYAASAGRLPLTLVNCLENSLDGLLFNYSKLNIEFENKVDLISEVNKLLHDDDYRKKKEKILYDCVINEDVFQQELGNLLRDGKNKFEFKLHDIDTVDFRKSYKYRFTKENLVDAIINKKTKTIWCRYPWFLMYKIWYKSIKKMGE